MILLGIMASPVTEFLYSPTGLIIVGGLGLVVGVAYAYSRASDSDVVDVDKQSELKNLYYEAIKRHGANTNRPLIYAGRIIGLIRKEVHLPERSIPEQISSLLDDDGDDMDASNGLIKVLACKHKIGHRLLSLIPLIRKAFLETYIISKTNVVRSKNNVVLQDNIVLDKFAGLWLDQSVGAISDVMNVHGLDLLEVNMEANEEFADRMIALDPSTARDKVLISEEYSNKADMFNSKKKSNHG